MLMTITDHARSHPNAIALSCPERVTTYRKLGSRIERATARLQGEWDVKAGDVVAYCGAGHQDAVVLFLALAQCGASLLVTPAGDGESGLLLQEYRIRMVLTDAGESVQNAPAGIRIEPLHAIIAEHCPHPARPIPVPGDQCRLLRRMPVGGSVVHAASAAELMAAHPAGDALEAINRAGMFDEAIFGPRILATLQRRGSVHLA